MRFTLITLGDPATLTGGYLYHGRMAKVAPAHGSTLSFVSFPERPFPLPAAHGRGVLHRVREHRPDAVILDSIAAAFAAPWLRGLSEPLAAVVHQRPGGIDHGVIRSRLQRALDLIAYRNCVRILVASETLVTELTQHGIERRRIAVVAPGRDPAGVDPEPIDLRCGRAAALLCVANWMERKGIVELLQAVAELPASLCTLHLVGKEDVDPRYSSRVTEFLSRGDLEGRVVRHGPLSSPEVAQMYAAADVFVLPSMLEPYGTVYGEAMAAGLPVVGWNAGNLPHLARNGSDGLILAPGDILGLTNALEQLSQDEGLRNRMSESAKTRAQSLPTWEESAAQFFSELELAARSKRMT
jgi:glycosyltransferase involved in cell wall biosynthesis